MTDPLPEAPDFYGHTVFCDDVRYEIDGKVSYIGVYQGDMIVNGTAPFAIPKFAFVVEFSQKSEMFDPKVSFKVFLPGDPDDTPSVEAEAAGELSLPPPGDPEPKFTVMKALLVVSPLIVKEEGRIRVRISRGGTVHRAGSLYVRFATLPAASPNNAG